ncbi:MAG: hypothetical protein HY017_25545 [Betaproteobacteria bacterium]|nr:hypothetical protein [Betaproteobacteria bacterium]
MTWSRDRLMVGRTEFLAVILAFAVAPTAFSAGKGRASSSGASTAMMSGTTRTTPVTPASGGRGASTTTGGGGRYAGYHGAVPELDPSRKISEQDCTKPIVLDGGNLRCK